MPRKTPQSESTIKALQALMGAACKDQNFPLAGRIATRIVDLKKAQHKRQLTVRLLETVRYLLPSGGR